MVGLIWLLVIGLLSGCAGSADSPDNIPPPTDTRNPVNFLFYTRDVLSPASRLPAYSKVAERVSLVDPVTEQEVWHAEAKGYQYAIALPDLSGAALVSDSAIEVVTQNGRKRFDLSGTYYYSTSAQHHPTYVLMRKDIRAVDVIHSLGKGEWQVETFDLPWNIARSEPENSTALIINHQASQLIAFSLYDGSYAMLAASGEDGVLSTTQAVCMGVERAGASFRLYTAIAQQVSSGMLLVGDNAGHIFLVDPTAPCQTIDSLTSVQVDEGAEPVSIAVDDTGLIRILLANGQIWRSQITDALMSQPQQELSTSCIDSSALMLSFDNNYLLLVCARENRVSSLVSRHFNVASVILDYMTYDMTTGQLVSRFSLLQEESAGTGIDTQTGIMYRIKESSLGELEIYHLFNDEKRVVKGLFLQNFLDTL